MTDQDKLNLIGKYRNNPVAYIEDVYPDIKLYPYQKVILNAMVAKEKTFSFINARMNQKLWLDNMKLEWMKIFKRNFQVLSSKGVDVYENGVLVRTIKENN